MIECTLALDLPSEETRRRPNLVEWVGSLFGSKPDLRSGDEQLTVGGRGLLQGLYDALRDCGVEDAIALLVDKRVLYHDKEGHTRDISLMAAAAQESGALDRPFRELHLVLSTHHGGLHIITDVKVKALNRIGIPEVVIQLSGRAEALTAERKEDPAAFADRVRRFAADPHNMDALRLTLEGFAGQLAVSVRRHLPVVDVQQGPARIQVLRPDRATLRGMDGAHAGQGGPALREAPARAARSGGDVYGVYYHDPYWDLTSFVLWSSMLHSHHHTDVVYVDRTGSEVPGDAGMDTSGVSIGEGGVSVDAATMDAAPDGGWGGSETGGGWGGSDAGDAGGWGGSDAGDAGGSDAGSSDGGSSCGSSDGGSSCGSSCGGGCGGGGD